VPIPRRYTDWSPEPPLAPDVQVALSFLDEIVNGSEATAEIDGDGALRAFIQMDGVLGLYIDIGDSWGSVNYIGGSSRTPYMWRWDSQTTPGQLRALLDGRAVERVRLLGRRRVTATLVVEGRAVARYFREHVEATGAVREHYVSHSAAHNTEATPASAMPGRHPRPRTRPSVSRNAAVIATTWSERYCHVSVTSSARFQATSACGTAHPAGGGAPGLSRISMGTGEAKIRPLPFST